MKNPAGLLLLAPFLAFMPANAAAAENPGWTPIDCWTHIQNLESRKGFDTLRKLLTDVLTNAVHMAPLSRLKPDQVRNAPDPEGMAFLLDDLANLYTSGFVDFELADEFNRLCGVAVERIDSLGLANVPVSLYFNPRRSLY